MSTARNHHHRATADELAAALVTHRLEMFDGIRVSYDPCLVAPYAVNPGDRVIVLPEGLTWRQRHARINRAWLFLKGGVALAPEFAGVEHDNPDRHIIGGGASVSPAPLLRRVW